MLLKKGVKWQWNKQHATDTEAKSALQDDTLLVHYDSTCPLIVACDASPYRSGGQFYHML